MKKLFSLLLLSVLITGRLQAQEGATPLTHFQESRDIEDQSWAICQDGYKTMLFANRRGIMTFDGQKWDFVRMPAVAYSLSYSAVDNRVYTGCDNNYGYLEKDEKGFYQFRSMNEDTSAVGLISKIFVTDSTIWFYSETAISRHNVKSGALEKRYKNKDGSSFTGMFLTPSNIFINVSSEGLYRIEADTLFPIVTGYLTKDESILFSLPYDSKQVLLGLGNSSIKIFDGIKYHDSNIKDEGYLTENILSDGIAVNDSLYAFSTVNGGCIVTYKKTGSLCATINYQNGLPDDEVYAISSDDQTGLWISHQFGLSRAALKLPAGNFSIYPGLSGNLSSVLWHNNELYVATSEGVFYLDEVRNYGEVEVMVKNEKAVSGPAAVSPSSQAQPETGKAKRGLLSKIFGKKESTSKKTAEESTKTAAPEPQFVSKKISRLKSINYIYRRVSGINEKCLQMVSASGGILVSTNNGLFFINEHRAVVVEREVYVNHISKKLKGDRFYIATADGYFYVTFNSGKWNVIYPDRKFTQPLYSVTADSKDVLWAGGNNVVYSFITAAGKEQPEYETYSVQNDYPNKYIVENINDTIFLFTEGRIFCFSQSGNNFNEYTRAKGEGRSKTSYILSQPGIAWFNSGEEWIYMPDDGRVKKGDAAMLNIFDKVTSVSLSDKYLWAVTGNNQVSRIELNKNLSVHGDVNLFIRSINNQEGEFFRISDAVLRRGDNTVSIDIVSPGYLRQNSTQYQYLLEGVMSEWSKWSTSSTITLMPPAGNHKLKVRARDIWGNISEPQTLKFTIREPFYQTTAFYVIILIIALSLVLFITRAREQKLIKENLILEEKVQERTREIQAQKEEITSSIEYASRIQMAMLPMKELYKKNFADHFVIFKPRDIVSGDFYWIDEDDKKIYFTVADCTGHGVPGAFMSMLGISTLHEIISNRNDLDAATILNILKQKIKSSLHQTGKEGEAADGMDIAFCVLHKDKKKLEFAGAYNPLIIFQKGVMKEFKADRMPIGIYYGEKETFTNVEVKVSKGDVLYIFSDGICDQFGGATGTKFKMANLKKLLTEINEKPLSEQKDIIEAEFTKWKGPYAQVDDVSIVGVKI
jgi:serine phosphatase RsbU (regulator of sigma subunit)